MDRDVDRCTVKGCKSGLCIACETCNQHGLIKVTTRREIKMVCTHKGVKAKRKAIEKLRYCGEINDNDSDYNDIDDCIVLSRPKRAKVVDYHRQCDGFSDSDSEGWALFKPTDKYEHWGKLKKEMQKCYDEGTHTPESTRLKLKTMGYDFPLPSVYKIKTWYNSYHQKVKKLRVNKNGQRMSPREVQQTLLQDMEYIEYINAFDDEENVDACNLAILMKQNNLTTFSKLKKDHLKLICKSLTPPIHGHNFSKKDMEKKILNHNQIKDINPTTPATPTSTTTTTATTILPLPPAQAKNNSPEEVQNTLTNEYSVYINAFKEENVDACNMAILMKKNNHTTFSKLKKGHLELICKALTPPIPGHNLKKKEMENLILDHAQIKDISTTTQATPATTTTTTVLLLPRPPTKGSKQQPKKKKLKCSDCGK
eukprot:Pgem_evm1s2216